MTVTCLRFLIRSATLFMIFGASAYSQDETILAINYDISITVGEQDHSVQNSALVRSGSEVPTEMQNLKVGLRIAESPENQFSLNLLVYERTDSGWYQINVPPPEFDGKLGVPTEIGWELGDIKVDLAIIVGVRP